MAYDHDALAREIRAEENRIPWAYKDSKGLWTIGEGFLIDRDRGGRMPDAVIDFWRDLIIADREKALDRAIPWWRQLSDARQRALINMAYQMGAAGLLAFRGMLAALQAGDYEAAADEALDSKWARDDSPARAKRIADMIRKG